MAGRFAGRKAVVIKASDEAAGSKKFGHAIVAGIDRYPRKVVKAMGQKKLAKRSKIQPFVKSINLNHVMPTRYSVDFDLKKTVSEEQIAPNNRVETKKSLKKLFEEKYKTQVAKSGDKKALGVQYFFNKLRF